jgi:hypothetical protein
MYDSFAHMSWRGVQENSARQQRDQCANEVTREGVVRRDVTKAASLNS